jgi:hypothetical protein
MDILDRMRSARVVQGVSARVRALPRQLERAPAAAFVIRERSRFAGIALLVASICFGLWARDLARAESLSAWLSEHPPSDSVWRHALESRGYALLEEEAAYRRAARTLPSLSDDASTVWISPDALWIAVYRRGEDRIDATLYCLRCKEAPSGWQPAGRGWEAFEPVLELADAARSRLPKPVVQRKREWIDPMELRY